VALERALRIQPHNPQVWLELARVRFGQRHYAESATMASKARELAGEDRALATAAEHLLTNCAAAGNGTTRNQD
jgi:cytochrome c-type biogenesis protein CcmH/NrfG